MSANWQDDLLAFWFVELAPAQWFAKNDAVDAAIDRRFRAIYEREASAFELDNALASPATALACSVLLDQIPRNIFRGSARAFESDAKALNLARAAVDRGLDLAVEPVRRTFLYLPFEHSEALADQERCVGLFAALGDANTYKYAIAHHAIISRFGRFPHRNAVVGRRSTEEEIAFLATPGSSF